MADEFEIDHELSTEYEMQLEFEAAEAAEAAADADAADAADAAAELFGMDVGSADLGSADLGSADLGSAQVSKDLGSDADAADASVELFGMGEEGGGGASPRPNSDLGGSPSPSQDEDEMIFKSRRKTRANTRSLMEKSALGSSEEGDEDDEDEQTPEEGDVDDANEWDGHGRRVRGQSSRQSNQSNRATKPHEFLTKNAAVLDRLDEKNRSRRSADERQRASENGGGNAAGAGGAGGAGSGLGSGGADAGSQPREPVQDSITYDGFDEDLLRAEGLSRPLLMPQTGVWKLIPSVGPDELKPKRAMCLAVLTDFFKRDAEYFASWQLPVGHQPRCKATAAILSLLFAGTYQGLPSGNHEERTRFVGGGGEGGDTSGGKRAKGLTKVKSYTYAPADDESDSWPMISIGLEEIYDYDQRNVLALRVWLFVFDETHSTSGLMQRVTDTVHSLHASQCAGAVAPELRCKNLVSETSRRDKAGMGFGELDSNFEGTVGMQYSRIRTGEDWRQMLELHSGRTTDGPGCPCIGDLSRHLNCPGGRRKLEGDYVTNCGSRHPAAVEFLLNAKRRESLAFGLAGLDGMPLDVCEEQLDPAQYWQNDGFFRLPKLDRPCFWLCTSPDRRSIFGMPLARTLQGTVVPGEWMTRLAVEMERRAKHASNGGGASELEPEDLEAEIDQNAHNRIRSLMTRKDEHQRKQDQLMRSTLQAHDLMTGSGSASSMTATGGSGAGAGSGGGSGGDENDGQQFTIRVNSMTKRVAIESDRFFSGVVTPWKSSELAELDRLHREMVKVRESGDEDGAAELQDAYWVRRSAFQNRFYQVKRDLTRYHLKLIRTCFLSTKDAATLPAGYNAMYHALEKGVEANGGSASIAFNGGLNGRGRQIMCKDRMVWGSLQEWLRCVFVDDCKIDGRDRRCGRGPAPPNAPPAHPPTTGGAPPRPTPHQRPTRPPAHHSPPAHPPTRHSTGMTWISS